MVLVNWYCRLLILERFLINAFEKNRELLTLDFDVVNTRVSQVYFSKRFIRHALEGTAKDHLVIFESAVP